MRAVKLGVDARSAPASLHTVLRAQRSTATQPASSSFASVANCGRHFAGQQHCVTASTAAAGLSAAETSSSSSSSSSRPGDEYFQLDTRPVILFDGVCNLCNGGVNVALGLEAGPSLRFTALQSGPGRVLLQRSGRHPDDISSIVLVEQQQSYIKSEAVLRIGQHMKQPLPVLAAAVQPFPLGFRDAVYDLVANNRYNLFGRTPSCRLSDDRCAGRFLVE